MPDHQSDHSKKVSALDVIKYTVRLVIQKFSPSTGRLKKFLGTLPSEKLKQYGLLMRVDKPIGSLLLLWPTLWALWLASPQFPQVIHIVIFSLGVFLMRSAGCVINDYADRHIDGNVSRTKHRPMARGLVSEREALVLFIILALIAFSLVVALNQLSVILSFVALAIATVYPFMKRVTYFPQVVLGMAFSMAIPMAFAAVLDEIPMTAWLLYISNLLWVLAYDTLYGMVDKKDDLKIGVKSTAIFFGEADLQITAIIQAMFVFGMLLVGAKFNLNYWFYCSMLIASGLIAIQIYSCRNREPEKCFKAFLNNNWIGLVVFLGVVASKLSTN
ncbi:MAG: 4-hydroxybenzoate octaprenyltransferase [Kangiellaceae bacterium]|nr:4-hydroxybenzoate octaprenyltransferase [Kangiellaceae bacterium]